MKRNRTQPKQSQPGHQLYRAFTLLCTSKADPDPVDGTIPTLKRQNQLHAVEYPANKTAGFENAMSS